MNADQSLVLVGTACIGLIWLAGTLALIGVAVRYGVQIRRLRGGSGVGMVILLAFGACVIVFWLGFLVVLLAGMFTAFFAAGG